MASDRLKRHIDRLLDEADEAIIARNWEAVRERAQDILAIDPENSDGLAILGTAERARQDGPPSASLATPDTTQLQAPEPNPSNLRPRLLERPKLIAAR